VLAIERLQMFTEATAGYSVYACERRQLRRRRGLKHVAAPNYDEDDDDSCRNTLPKG